MVSAVISLIRRISDRTSKFSNFLSIISTVKCFDSVLFLVFFLFFVKDQMASFTLKQIEGSVPCVFHSCVAAIEFYC